jgi:hypothetical protein
VYLGGGRKLRVGKPGLTRQSEANEKGLTGAKGHLEAEASLAKSADRVSHAGCIARLVDVSQVPVLPFTLRWEGVPPRGCGVGSRSRFSFRPLTIEKGGADGKGNDLG